MSDLNSCSFIGRLGREPEMRTLGEGKCVVNFSIAVTRKYKDKEETEWVNCTAFDKLAEIIDSYAKVGSQLYVSGRMKTDKYDKDGRTMYATKIVVQEMQLLGSKKDFEQTSKSLLPRSAPKDIIIDDSELF